MPEGSKRCPDGMANGTATGRNQRQPGSDLTESRTETELLMRHSPTTYLEVLTAQQSLLVAELAEAQDRFDEIQGVIDLYHALGGGL